MPDDSFLRLYDRYNHLRLTPFEAEAERAEREARRADAAEQRARELEAQMRALGLDTDQLL